jgi:catechol 2,3-dioxygenase-like lactoylglutathione lyase family enzyme
MNFEMKLSSCFICLFVKSIKTSKNFYERFLNIPVRLDFGKNVIFEGGLSIWEIDRLHIIPATLGESKINDSSVNRFELYFETDRLQNVYDRLKEAGIKFLHEIHEEMWGQQTIRFYDPDGHLVEVGESMQLFVRRFHQQGYSIEEVSKKTHIPVDEVKKLISEE